MTVPLDYAAELDDRKFHRTLDRIEGRSRESAKRIDKGFQIAGAAVALSVGGKAVSAFSSALRGHMRLVDQYAAKWDFAKRELAAFVGSAERGRTSLQRLNVVLAESGPLNRLRTTGPELLDYLSSGAASFAFGNKGFDRYMELQDKERAEVVGKFTQRLEDETLAARGEDKTLASRREMRLNEQIEAEIRGMHATGGFQV